MNKFIPREILLNEILLKLSFRDILNICIANKSFNQLCKDDHLWSLLLERDFKYDSFLFQKENLSSKNLYKLLIGLRVVQKFLNINTYAKEYSLYKLYSLQHLFICGNQLTSIPKEIENLVNLREFSLSRNKLKSIPKEIGALVNLERLWLSHNKLTSIPNEIGNLTNLQYLYLQFNQLTSIPKELGECKNLRILDLYGNPIPQEILDLQPGLTLDLLK